MKMVKCGSPILLLMVAAACTGFCQSSTSTEKLSRPKFKKGDVVFAKSVITMSEAKLTAPEIPKDSDIRLSLRMRINNSTEILATDENGAVSETEEETQAAIIQTEATGKREGKDYSESTMNSLPMDEVIARYSQKKGVWIGRLRDGETTIEAQNALDGYASPDEDTIIPDNPVGIGDEWTIKGAKLRRFAPDAIKLEGAADCSFEKIIKLNDRPHALIKLTYQLEYTRLDENQGEQKCRLVNNGYAWIDIKTGIETEVSVKGSIIIEGDAGPIKNAKITGVAVVTGSKVLLRKQ